MDDRAIKQPYILHDGRPAKKLVLLRRTIEVNMFNFTDLLVVEINQLILHVCPSVCMTAQ